MDLWNRIKKMTGNFRTGEINLSNMIDKRYRMSGEESERMKLIYRNRRKPRIPADELSAKEIVGPTTSADGSEDNESEAVLQYDVLDRVFSHLNAKDLAHAARVSKSWRDAARWELSRRGPEIAILKYAYDCEYEFDYSTVDEDEMRKIRDHENSTHVSNFIRSKPEVSLFFTHPFSSAYKEPWYLIQGRFLGDFMYELPVIVIETLGVGVDETQTIGINQLTAGLFLPSSQTLNVHVVWPYRYEIENNHDNEDYARGIVEELFPAEEEHTCIIMFTENLYHYGIESEISVAEFQSDVLCNLKERRELGTYALWGAGVASMTMTGSRGDDAVPWMGVSISGPTLRSWAIVLDCSLPTSDVERKLLTFKKDVRLRSEAVALMLVPSNRNTTRDEKLARITPFKKIFPGVRLLTVFNDREYPVYSFNSNSVETEEEISHTNSVSYLILSYGYTRHS